VTFVIDRPPVVVDASVAIGGLLRQEARGLAAFEGWRADERVTLVPTGFWAEVANGLLVGNRIDPAKTQTYLALLADFGVEVADRGLDGVLDAIGLAARHRITVYDALYLQLALDTDATLATLDGDLSRAAREEGVELEAV
jgi:predicted nucleic acid-binding protein